MLSLLQTFSFKLLYEGSFQFLLLHICQRLSNMKGPKYLSWQNLRLWNWKSGHLPFSWFFKNVLPKSLSIDSFLEQSADKSLKYRRVTRNLSGQRIFLGIRAPWYSSKTQKRKAKQGKILGFSSKKNLKVAF